MSDVPATAAWTLALLLPVSDRPRCPASQSDGDPDPGRTSRRCQACSSCGWPSPTGHRLAFRGRPRACAGRRAAVLAHVWIAADQRIRGLGQYYAWRYASRKSPLSSLDRRHADAACPVGAGGSWRPGSAPARPASPAARRRVDRHRVPVDLLYTPFDAWWFLRFLLPVWPAMMVATAAALDAFARRWTGRWSSVVAWAIVAAVGWRGVPLAGDRSAFDPGWGVGGERRAIRGGAHGARCRRSLEAAQRIDPALCRPLTLRFDMLDRAALDRAIAFLQSSGGRHRRSSTATRCDVPGAVAGRRGLRP